MSYLRCQRKVGDDLCTGYDQHQATGEYQDFVVGFTAGHQVWGRPVDVAFAQDGSLLFSDDGNGVIYRVSHKGQ
jgi:glucose/arabinose dehydrogenase